MTRKVLVAGIGNVLRGDDGFGVEVAKRLAERELPPDARAVEYGIRGVHLAYELLEGYTALVLLDAVPMSEPPGTLAILAPEPPGAHHSEQGEPSAGFDAHSMSPVLVLDTFARLGGRLDRVLVLGCSPANLDDGIGLSPAVAAAVEPAADLCIEIVGEILEEVKGAV